MAPRVSRGCGGALQLYLDYKREQKKSKDRFSNLMVAFGLAAGVELPCKVEDSIAKKSSGMDGYLLDGYLSRGCGGTLQGC